MDKMTLSELPIILSQIQYADRNIWETTRLQCLVYAQKNCKKKLKASDIFTLPWDSQKPELKESDFAKLKAREKEMEALVNAHAKQHRQTNKKLNK